MQGLKLARDIRIPIKESEPATEKGLIEQYAELKLLS